MESKTGIDIEQDMGAIYCIGLVHSYPPTQKIVKDILLNDLTQRIKVIDMNPKDLGMSVHQYNIDLLITNPLGLYESQATNGRWYSKDGEYDLEINGKPVRTFIINDIKYNSFIEYVNSIIEKTKDPRIISAR